MKTLIKNIIIILVVTITYTGRYRISMSNFYKRGLLNEQIFSNNPLTISGSTNFIETVFYPLEKQSFKLQITGAIVIGFFFVYDTLGFKEYKISSSVQKQSGDIYEIQKSQKIKFDTETGIKHFLRNTFLDQGGKLIGVSIQLAPIQGENISIVKL